MRGCRSSLEALSKVASDPFKDDVSIGMLTEDGQIGRHQAQGFTAALASLRPNKPGLIAEEHIPSLARPTSRPSRNGCSTC